MLLASLTRGLAMRTWTKQSGWLLLALLASPAFAQPSGGHGDPKTKTGLGEAYPAAANMSVDTNWSVYAFENEAIKYLQINDLSGNVRAIVSYIDDDFAVLPAGTDVTKVSTPQKPLPIPAASVSRVVYRDQNVELIVYATTNGTLWSVRKPTP